MAIIRPVSMDETPKEKKPIKDDIPIHRGYDTKPLDPEKLSQLDGKISLLSILSQVEPKQEDPMEDVKFMNLKELLKWLKT